MQTVGMPPGMYADILAHLFPKGDHREQGGFLFCHYEEERQSFRVLEWLPLSGSDYAYQERDYLELSDDMRAHIIKKAHDMEASLVEIHCHPGQYKVAFSIADWLGFKEFVPHIRWRLAKRPYCALVFGYDSVDGFVWADDSITPSAISGITADNKLYSTTGISFNALQRGMYGKI